VTTLLRRAILRVPLYGKLIGANLVMLAIAAFLLSGIGASVAPIAVRYDYFVFAGLCVGALLNGWLVRIALQPIRELQRVTERVGTGARHERVRHFPHADSRIQRLIETTNQMLDRLDADRSRMKKLGAEVVYAQEEERADVARELHESVAQTLTAAGFQLTAALSREQDPKNVATMKLSRELINSALEEIRSVSQSLHPRIAADLGLPAALESLAGIVRQRSLIEVFVVTDIDDVIIPRALSATLYRVAREAFHDVELRGDANSATVVLKAKDGKIELTIIDDGSEHPEIVRAIGEGGSAFKAARERFSLAGGEMHIERVATGGTRVTATINTGLQAA
jgi:signal transduction histidine kinase